MGRSSRRTLLETLEARFTDNPARHPKVTWRAVAARLAANPKALDALAELERTGGEPDVVAVDAKSGRVTFMDCSAESPAGRRSLCYDGAALRARKANKPKSSALEVAEAMGVQVLDEAQYRALQQLGEFDLETSSWVRTPADIRALGGALFCDRRFGHVFTYHNGAESYYAARGFRAALEV